MQQSLKIMPKPIKQRRLRHHFIAAWIRSPLKMGAALPSSRSLARAMVAQVDMSRPGSIIELGAGTGMMTHALVEADAPRDKLLVIERDKKLHALLRATFHDLKILCADAMDLENVLREHNMQNVNAIVSSLPFITMPVAVRNAIQEQMAKVIGEQGIIVQFTYGHKSPIGRDQMRRLGLVGERVKLVLVNVPPAHVWVYRRA